MKYFKFFIFSSVLALGLLLNGTIKAQNQDELSQPAMEQVKYPIVELGNCANKEACRNFCDQKENMLVCLNYAENKSLLPAAKINIARKAINRIRAGQTPGNCQDKQSCEQFCRGNVESMQACVAFAEEVGALDGLELERAKKVVKALKDGAELPGGCSDNQSCEQFCKQLKNMEACLTFAERAQIMSREQIQEARKIAPLLQSGQTPGGCQTKQACSEYCAEETHSEECLTFAEKVGFVSKDEAELSRKTGGKGPGGCQGKEACQEFCAKSDNAEVCRDFALKYDLMSDQDKADMQNGANRIREGLKQIPEEARTEVQTCLNNLLEGKLEAFLSGDKTITKEQAQKIGPCFQETMNKYQERLREREVNKAMESQALPEGVKFNQDQIRNQLPTSRQPTLEEIQELKNKIQEQERERIKQQQEQKFELQKQQMEQAGEEQKRLMEQQKQQIELQQRQGSPTPPCSSPEECQKMFGQ